MRIRNRIYFMRDWTKFLVCWLSTNAQTFSFIRVWDRLYYKHNEGLDWPLFWYLRILVGVSLTTWRFLIALAVSTSGSLKEVSELEVPSTGSAVGNWVMKGHWAGWPTLIFHLKTRRASHPFYSRANLRSHPCFHILTKHLLLSSRLENIKLISRGATNPALMKLRDLRPINCSSLRHIPNILLLYRTSLHLNYPDLLFLHRWLNTFLFKQWDSSCPKTLHWEHLTGLQG